MIPNTNYRNLKDSYDNISLYINDREIRIIEI